MPSVWFVDASRTAVTWGTAVTGAPGRRTAQTDIYRIVRDGAPRHESTQLWARAGSRVDEWPLTRAQTEQSSDAVPAAWPLPAASQTPGASTGTSGRTGLTPDQVAALAADVINDRF
jgi:hypothetical protein